MKTPTNELCKWCGGKIPKERRQGKGASFVKYCSVGCCDKAVYYNRAEYKKAISRDYYWRNREKILSDPKNKDSQKKCYWNNAESRRRYAMQHYRKNKPIWIKRTYIYNMKDLLFEYVGNTCKRCGSEAKKISIIDKDSILKVKVSKHNIDDFRDYLAPFCSRKCSNRWLKENAG